MPNSRFIYSVNLIAVFLFSSALTCPIARRTPYAFCSVGPFAIKIMTHKNEIKYYLPLVVPMTITICQTLQMAIGMVTAISAGLYHMAGRSCDVTLSSMAATLSMSSFYFTLFAKFFVQRYITSRKIELLLKTSAAKSQLICCNKIKQIEE